MTVSRKLKKLSLVLAVSSSVFMLNGCVTALVGATAAGAGALIGSDSRTVDVQVDDQKIEVDVGRILTNDRMKSDGKRFRVDAVSVNGNVLLVSQFTLAANTSAGNRPSFDPAMAPNEAKDLYAKFTAYAHQKLPSVQEGVFAADMKVSLENDGPVTFMLKI